MLAEEEEDDEVEEFISIESDDECAEDPNLVVELPSNAQRSREQELRDQEHFKLTKIQAHARGRLARKHAEERRERQAQVTKIQARARGFLARKKTKDRMSLHVDGHGVKSPDLGAGSPSRAQPASDLPDLSEFSEDDTQKLKKIQAGARGLLARKEVRASHPHMNRIRAQARGHQERSEQSAEMMQEIQADRHMARSAAQPQRGSQLKWDRFEDHFTKEEAAKKVPKIQAAARGYFARKRARNAAQATQESPTDRRARNAVRSPEDVMRSHYTAESSSSMGRRPRPAVHASGDDLRSQPAEDGLRSHQTTEEFSTGRRLRHVQTNGRNAHVEELPDLCSFSQSDTSKVTKIQAGARGLLARRQTRQKAEEKEKQDKIARIQAGARGYLARKAAKGKATTKCEAHESPVIKPQAESRSLLAHKMQKQASASMAADARDEPDFEADAAVRRPAVAAISESCTDKATKIQSGARGFLARKRLKAAEEQQRSKADRVDEEPIALSTFSEEDVAKVTKMQAGARGLLARRHTHQQKAVLRAKKAKDDALPNLSTFSDADTAKVTKIQAGARGLLARKQSHQRKAEHAQPAVASEKRLSDLETAYLTKLQAGARGYLARKHVKQDGAKTLSKAQQAPARSLHRDDQEELPDLHTFSKADTAKVTKIQAGARGLLARSGMARKRASQSQEMPDLDTFSNADTAKVTKIQAGARGLLARKHARAHRNSCQQPQEELPDLHAFSKADTAKVTKIQAGARGLLVRKHARAHQSSSDQRQVVDVTTLSQEDAAKLTKIQAGARGLLARKQTREMKSQEEEKRAKIAKLQANFRGHLARKNHAELKKDREGAQRAADQAATANSSPQAATRLAEATLFPQQFGPGAENTTTQLEETMPFPPQKPPGAPPVSRRPRYHLKPRPPLDPIEAMSESFLTQRAEKRLQTIMHATLHNVPTFYPKPPSTPPRVKLGTLSEAAQRSMLQLERLEVKARLKQDVQQEQEQRQRREVMTKLDEWHVQREAAKQAEEERKRALEEEKERAAQEDKKKWKRRGEALSRKVADWGAEKAEREERMERENKVAEEEAKRKAMQKQRNHCRKLKDRLAQWHSEQEKKRAAEQVAASSDLQADAPGDGLLAADAAAELPEDAGVEQADPKDDGLEDAKKQQVGTEHAGLEDVGTEQAGIGDVGIAQAGMGDAGVECAG